jgi:hypothetical protein
VVGQQSAGATFAVLCMCPAFGIRGGTAREVATWENSVAATPAAVQKRLDSRSPPSRGQASRE